MIEGFWQHCSSRKRGVMISQDIRANVLIPEYKQGPCRGVFHSCKSKGKLGIGEIWLVTISMGYKETIRAMILERCGHVVRRGLQ